MSIIERFDTIAEAVRKTGINSKSIRDAAKGIQNHAGGFIWRYSDEFEHE
jgi:DNA polymerase-3 subunit epsilon